MKKRFVTTLLALVACIACVVGLVACGDDAEPVAGKTYIFQKAEVSGAPSGTGDLLTQQQNALYAGSTITFTATGYTKTQASVTLAESGTYRQDGSKLEMIATSALTGYAATTQATVSGNSLIIVSDMASGIGGMGSIGVSNIKLTLYYTLYQTTIPNNPNLPSNPNNPSQGGSLSVAGKTYVMSDFIMDGSSMWSMVSSYYAGSKLVFDQQGKYTMTMMGETVTGTYTETATAVSLDTEGTLTKQGNTLRLTEETTNATIVFTLQG